MSKIFIASNSMIVGGIEKSLISLLNSIDYSNNEVTLLLQEKVGSLLEQIPNQVNIIEYKPIISKNIFLRKITNRINYYKFILKYKNKFDVSICYTSYIYVPSLFVRKICKNNYMWVHSDYTKIYDNKGLTQFVEKYGYKKYKNLVFVSETSLNNYPFKNKNQNYIVCPNILKYEEIINLSNKYEIEKNKKITFLNVGRHDEETKNLSKIILSALKLKEVYTDFEVILVGNGPSNELYKELVKKYELNNWIKFVDETTNPFPYYKASDCFIITSKHEGGPITFYESLILKTPVISTDVGDIKKYLTKENGILINFEEDSLFEAMLYFINNKEQFNPKFDYIEYNNNSLNIIKKIIER